MVGGTQEGADVFGGLWLEDGDAEVSVSVGEFAGRGGGGDCLECVRGVFDDGGGRCRW